MKSQVSIELFLSTAHDLATTTTLALCYQHEQGLYGQQVDRVIKSLILLLTALRLLLLSHATACRNRALYIGKF